MLAAHAALLVWSALANSVTFDENFHVPAGVALVTHGAFHTSPVNPPLVKALFGLAALSAGARPPALEAIRDGEQSVVGESFMRINAARYHRVFVAARAVVMVSSLVLGMLVWRMARRAYGRAGGLLALGFYAFAPEALAHGSVATVDVPTALAWTGCVYAFWCFARSGRWGWWWVAAATFGAAMLVRFTSPLLLPALAAIAGTLALGRRLRRPARTWAGIALLIPVGLVSLQVGYLGRTTLHPSRDWTFYSRTFLQLQRRLPGVPIPLPDAYIDGMDRQAFESQPGTTPTFVNGRVYLRAFWWYLPYAMLLKWPLALMAAVLVRGLQSLRRRRDRGAYALVAPGLLLAGAMLFGQLDVGIRYVFPLVPALCVWLGGLATPRSGPEARFVGRKAKRAAAGWAAAGVTLALLHATESASAAPWHLAFFNQAAGGPGEADRRVNDSNVDWGQGLIALRDELRRRGIERVHLAYHGTADPALYGIDYIPYQGGTPGPESPWLAVSSYYFVGLSSRMMTTRGRSPFVVLDFQKLRGRPAAARPAHCMYLFKVR